MGLALYAGPIGAKGETFYGSAGFTGWPGPVWLLPRTGQALTAIPDTLQTALQASNGWTLDNAGNGGRFVAGESGLVEAHASFTVARPPAVSLDAKALFNFAAGAGIVTGSQQSKRLNIIDCDDVVTLAGVFPVFAGQTVGVVGGSDAAVAGSGLSINLLGYTLVARFVQVL